MTDRRTPGIVSRRALLAGLGAAGTAGALGGVGTAAFFADRERMTSNTLRAGALDLEMDCETDNCTIASDGRVTITLTDVVPGDAGVETVRLDLLGNPGWLWLASTCPGTALESAIDVRIGFDRGCDGGDEFSRSGTLADVLLELSDGVRPIDECLDPAEPACLTLEWAFPYRPGIERYAGETIGFEILVYLEQCRHNDGSGNPFELPECEVPEDRHGISYVEIWGCLEEAPDCDCTRIGKLELSDAYVERCDRLETEGIYENRIEPGRYDLPVDDDCEDTGFDLVVTSTSSQDGETTAIAFELVDEDDGPGPDLCKVVVKGGPTDVVYDGTDLVPRSNATPGELAAPSR